MTIDCIRRAALTLFAAALLALAVPVHAAGSPPLRRILHICDCPAAMAADERAQLLRAFGHIGYMGGRDLDLTTHDGTAIAGGESFAALIRRDIAARPPELILVSGVRAAVGAHEATTATPVVFWRLTDPVGLGLVSRLNRPGGNFTGFSRAIEKLGPKRLELLHEMVPSARRIAFVFIADNPQHRRQASEVGAVAPSLGVTVRDYSLPKADWTAARLDTLFARMRGDGIEAMLLPDLNVEPIKLVGLAAKYRLPTVHSLTHVVTDWGGLAAYATVATDTADVAAYADRILKGAKPGELPVQEPTRFELVLNARAARQLELVFPAKFLLQASEVVEK